MSAIDKLNTIEGLIGEIKEEVTRTPYSEENVVSRFLDLHIIDMKDGKVRRSLLWNMFRNWCESNSITAPGLHTYNNILREMGYKFTNTRTPDSTRSGGYHNINVWRGMALKNRGVGDGY